MEAAAISLFVVFGALAVTALACVELNKYLVPSTLNKEADQFVNTAIDLGMVTYDDFNATIEGWGEVWITNHPYASGTVYLYGGPAQTRIRYPGYASGRLRLRTVNRLRRERRKHKRVMRSA